MALGGLPPWLNVQPSDFVHAAAAGATLGHAIADSTMRAWEEQARMRMAAQEAAANREQHAQQLAVDNAMARLAADRLEAYRQSEIANRKAELGLQEKGLGLRGEGLDIQRQRAEDALTLGQGRLAESKERESDRQAQRDFMNEFRKSQLEAIQEARKRALDLREQGLTKERPVMTKISADEFGPELSGPIDSPEIVNRLKLRDAKKSAPGALDKIYNYFTGHTPTPLAVTGSIPMNPVYPNDNSVAAPPPSSIPLTRDKASEFLKQANGDKDKARKLAKDAGYTF